MATRDGSDDGAFHDVNDDSGNNGAGADDVLRGGDADDRLTGRIGDDHMDGGRGIDTAVFHGERGAYTIVRVSDDTLHVSGQDGSDVLQNIERLQFEDRKVAFDLGSGQAADATVRLIGAAFGADAVHEHSDYVGVGLQLFDSGHSLHDVAELAAKAMGMDDSAFIDTVYKNTVGTAPTHEAHDFYESLLQGHGGTMTRGDLLAQAAGTDANAQQIDLVGLQHSGVDYI
jgi:hypothetical protein